MDSWSGIRNIEASYRSSEEDVVCRNDVIWSAHPSRRIPEAVLAGASARDDIAISSCCAKQGPREVRHYRRPGPAAGAYYYLKSCVKFSSLTKPRGYPFRKRVGDAFGIAKSGNRN